MLEAGLLVASVVGWIGYTVYQERKLHRDFNEVVDRYGLVQIDKLKAEWRDEEIGLVTLDISPGYQSKGHLFNLTSEPMNISRDVGISVHGRTGIYAGTVQPSHDPLTINPLFDRGFRVYSSSSETIIQAMLPDDLQKLLLRRGPAITELGVQVNLADKDNVWLDGRVGPCLSNFEHCQEILQRFVRLAKKS